MTNISNGISAFDRYKQKLGIFKHAYCTSLKKRTFMNDPNKYWLTLMKKSM